MLAGLALSTGVAGFASGVDGLRLLSCGVPRSLSKKLVPFGVLTGDVARGVPAADLDAVDDGVPLSQRLNVNLLLREGDMTGVPSAAVSLFRTGDMELRGLTGEISPSSMVEKSLTMAWLGRPPRRLASVDVRG